MAADITIAINLPPDVWQVIRDRATQINCAPESVASSWLQHFVLHQPSPAEITAEITANLSDRRATS